jgi:hypothetical protein
MNVERGGEKPYKCAIKLIMKTLEKIYELNTPQKYEKERELEKKDPIKKNHYMQLGQFLDLSFPTFTLFLLPFCKVYF